MVIIKDGYHVNGGGGGGGIVNEKDVEDVVCTRGLVTQHGWWLVGGGGQFHILHA
jgi:hypothetical protein